MRKKLRVGRVVLSILFLVALMVTVWIGLSYIEILRHNSDRIITDTTYNQNNFFVILANGSKQ